MLGKVRQGEKYTVEGRQGDWFKILLETGQEGYIFHSLVELSGREAGTTRRQSAWTDLIRRNSRSVVLIYVLDKQEKIIGRGTGFFIHRKGNLVTNYHVIEKASKVVIKLYDGQFLRVRGVLAEDPNTDLILLSVNTQGRTVEPLPVASVASISTGNRIVVIGSPLGLQGSVSDGLIAAVRRSKRYGTLLQITAPISAGSSGSPVMNERGEVVGVVTSFLSKGQNLNFAVSVEQIHSLRPGKVLALPAGRKGSPSFRDQREMITALKGLVGARSELEGYIRACITTALVHTEDYPLMTRRDAYLKINQLIFAHENSTNIIKNCITGVRPKIQKYRVSVHTLIIIFRTVLSEKPKIAERVGTLFNKGVYITSALVNEVFPKMVEIDKSYIEYFKRLKAGQPLNDNTFLSIPKVIDDLEKQVVVAAQYQAAAALAQMKGLYLVLPTPILRCRITISEIYELIIRSMGNLSSIDETNYLHKLSDARKSIKRAQRLAERERKRGDVKKRWPTVVRKYESLISEMKRIEKILGMFEWLKDYDFSGLSPEKKLKLYGLLQQIPRILSASAARLDEYAVAIDAEFSKKRIGLR